MTRLLDFVALFLGVFLISTAGPFLVASEMDILASVTIRLIASAAIFLVWAAIRGTLFPPREHLKGVIWGGVLLAGHFGFWLKAFDLTDYASNLLLLVMQPVFAAMLAPLVGEPTSRKAWIAVGIALLGLGIITGGDISLGMRALLGDALAIAGAFSIALFFTVTRDTRNAMPMSTFLGWSMAIGSVLVLPLALLSGDRFTGYSLESWGWMAALILLTTIGGHGLMNVAARRLKLFTLQVVIVLEPPLGIAMGALIFGAGVTAAHVVGGAILSVAVVVGLWPDREEESTVPSDALDESSLVLVTADSGVSEVLQTAASAAGAGAGSEPVSARASSALRTPGASQTTASY